MTRFDTILCHLQSTDILFLIFFSCYDHVTQLLGLAFFLMMGFFLYDIMLSETFWSQLFGG
jgi:hypothetical protein